MKKQSTPVHYLLVLLFVVVFGSAKAQNISLKGIVADSASGLPIDFASVVILEKTDSSAVSFTVTNINGAFEFKDVKPKEYLMQIFYVGYNLHSQFITIEDGKTTDLAKIALSPSSNTLSVALVTAKAIPIVFNGDTMVYNPNAFNTKESATVEDLLKKLPGVTVGRDGTVSAQGEKVVKVLVNGKEFFGNDPTKATQNIDAKNVAKVEVLDQKSENSEFTGVDDGQREKVINLVLKEDANKGTFGKIEAGGGTEETYRVKGTFNYFNKENQFAIIGNTNNLNQNGFNWQEYYQTLNGSQSISFGERTYWYSQGSWLGANQDGRQKAKVIGTSGNLKIGKKGELNGSLFAMNRTNSLISISNSENYLPGWTVFNSSNYISEGLNNQGRGFIKYRFKPDTLNWLTISAQSDLSLGNDASFSTNTNSNSISGFLNNSMSKTYSFKSNYNIKTSLSYYRKVKGTKNSWSVQGGVEHNAARDTSKWITAYSNYEQKYTDNVNYRYNDQILGTGNIAFGQFHYSAAIDSFEFLTFTINNKSTLGTYNMRRIYLPSDSLISGQSPNIATNYRVSSAQVGYFGNFVKKNGWYYHANLGLLSIGLDRKLTEAAKQAYRNTMLVLAPNFGVNYQKGKNFRWHSWFATQENFPGSSQINPIVDVRNPIRTQMGDLTLNPTFNYSLGSSFHKRNTKKNSYFGGWGNASFTPNSLINVQTLDSNNISFTTFENKKFTSSRYFNLNYGFSLKKLGIDISFNGGANQYQYYSQLNGILYENLRSSFDVGGDVEYSGDDLTVSFGYYPEYSTQKGGYVRQNPSYWQHTFDYEVILNITKRLEFSSEGNIYYYNVQSVGGKQSVPLINSKLSYHLDTTNRWIVRFSAYDMLKKNQSINRNFYGNSYSETRQNNITRYFMFSVEYAIRKGKQKEQVLRRWDG
ncbi:MAG: carboxypeptidase regulatory-like domain-containing protein [Flavobacteriales bacterium]|nr:carboxypeptidase regulatory-like domain-containing protein [Flavobacteriales bacterium]